MRKRSELRGSSSDDGFTLVELIMAIAIIGIISVPLGNVVIGYLRNTDATTARLLESHDVQIASAYWAQDIASIGTRSATSPFALNQSVWIGASGLAPTCTASGTAITSLAWDDFSAVGPATVVQVVYLARTVTVSSGRTETQLHRVRCNGSATVVSDVILAHNLAPLLPPTVACSTSCTAAPLVPKTVTLTVTLKNAGNRDTAYVVPLTGQRRES